MKANSGPQIAAAKGGTTQVYILMKYYVTAVFPFMFYCLKLLQFCKQ